MKQNELAVIGKAMIDQGFLDVMLAECTDEHFTLSETRFLFRLMSDLYADGIRPDARELMKRKPAAEAWIQEAFVTGTKATNIERDMNELIKTKNRALFLRMTESLLELTSDPLFEPRAAEEVINMLMPQKYGIINGKSMIEIAAAVEDATKTLDERMKNPGSIPGVSLVYENSNGAKVGFPSLDEAIYGLMPGDFVMFAAKSGHGKTAMAMNLTRIMAFHNKKRVYYLNTEMDLTQMVNRWASMATLIPYSNIERGDISMSDRERFGTWAKEFAKSPIIVSQLSSLTVESVKALTQMAQRKFGQVDCLIVDYVGRMDVESTKGMQEYQIMSYIARKLKTIAQDLGVPVIALAQLNDEGKLEGAKKMRNDVDGLFFLEPKIEEVEIDGQKVKKYSQSDYYLVREKVRRGMPGTARLEFDKVHQFIREV